MSVWSNERAVLSDCTEGSGGNAISKNKCTSFVSLIDQMNITNLAPNFITKEEGFFKKRIEQLNLKFYLETEKFLHKNPDMEKCQSRLFFILFKQISLYIGEIDRLNAIIQEKSQSEQSTKEKIDDYIKKEKEMSSHLHLISNLKQINKQLERKLNEKIISVDKAKSEIDSLKRQVSFYKDKLQIDLMMKKYQEECKKQSNTTEQKSNIPTGANKANGFDKGLISSTVRAEYEKQTKKKRNYSDNMKGNMNMNSTMNTYTYTSSQVQSHNKTTIQTSFADYMNKKGKNLLQISINSSSNTTNPSFNEKNGKPLVTWGLINKKAGNLKASLHKRQDFSLISKPIPDTCRNFNTTSDIKFQCDPLSIQEILLESLNHFDDELNELNTLETILHSLHDELRLNPRTSALSLNNSFIGKHPFSDTENLSSREIVLSPVPEVTGEKIACSNKKQTTACPLNDKNSPSNVSSKQNMIVVNRRKGNGDCIQGKIHTKKQKK